MTSYRHHGGRVVGVAEPARHSTRDSAAAPINVYSPAGGPRPEALADPSEVTMPEPGDVSESRTFEPPPGMTAAEVARRNEKYWTQANGLPEVERNRRAGAVYQRYLENWWSGKPAFVNFGAKAKDETGRLMEELCVLEEDDGMGNLSGSTESGDYYEIRKTGTGYTLVRERKDETPLQAITDRRSVSSKDRESAALTKMNERNAAFWNRPFRQKS
jgi:hypothetical protein